MIIIRTRSKTNAISYTHIVVVSICEGFFMGNNFLYFQIWSFSPMRITNFHPDIFRWTKFIFVVILVLQNTFCGSEDVFIWDQRATAKIKIGSIWIRLGSSQFSVGRLLKAARCSSHVSKTGNKWWKMVIRLIHSRLEVTYGHRIWGFLNDIGFTTPTTWPEALTTNQNSF